MGMKNSGAAFQRKMEIVLQGLIGKICQVYLDDILVFSEDLKQHAIDLGLVLQRLLDAGITLRLSKCVFMVKKLLFLGHGVSEGTISTDPEKTKAIANMFPPDSVTVVKRFLGMVGYYRRFFENFGKIALSLTDQKPGKFIITPEAVKAFEYLREGMIKEPILKMPDFDRPFRIRPDASDKAIGSASRECLAPCRL